MTTHAPPTSTSARAAKHRTTTRPAALLRALRPRQWVKNVLVAVAPLAAAAFQTAVLRDVAVAFLAFCLAASGIYLINDVRDVAADRAHPTKRHRPIAAGQVSRGVAVGVAVLLLGAALALSPLASVNLLIVVAVYITVQLGYCLWLKHEPVLDICLVASGFLLRAIAGGAATGVALSPWFLLVAAFGSLFMVTGKRYAEIQLAERTGAAIRTSLQRYTASYLRFVWALSATVLITTYSLWAFEIRGAHHGSSWPVISMVPFVVAVLRYAVDVDRGTGGTPEDIALSDRILQVLALLWLGTLALAIHS